MGKAASISNKSTKTPVLLYRFFLKLSMASIVYAIFKIATGTKIIDSALAVTVAATGAVAYELAYFIYKSASKSSGRDSTKGQIIVLTKLAVFFLGIFSAVYGAKFIYEGKWYGYLLLAVGIVLCQQIHNNKYIFSHLSTFCENVAAGLVVITMELIYNYIYAAPLGKYYLVFAAAAVLLYALSELFFHFFNVVKHKEKISASKHVDLRFAQFLRNVLVVFVIWLAWTLLILTGSVKAIIEAGMYEKVTKILPIGISITTASATIYLNFIKKPKDMIRYDPRIEKDDFKKLLQKRFGNDCKSVMALEYVFEEMNVTKGKKRYNGEDYYVHPFAVAKILFDNAWSDDALITAALLHDCVEDIKDCTAEKIVNDYGGAGAAEKALGTEISEIVSLLTKDLTVKRKVIDGTEEKEIVEHQGKNYKDYEVMKKYLDRILGTLDGDQFGNDERKYSDKVHEKATLIKIADRMNNNSTMSEKDSHTKLFKTMETKDMYQPFVKEASERYTKNKHFYEIATEFFKQEVK